MEDRFKPIETLWQRGSWLSSTRVPALNKEHPIAKASCSTSSRNSWEEHPSGKGSGFLQSVGTWDGGSYPKLGNNKYGAFEYCCPLNPGNGYGYRMCDSHGDSNYDIGLEWSSDFTR